HAAFCFSPRDVGCHYSGQPGIFQILPLTKDKPQPIKPSRFLCALSDFAVRLSRNQPRRREERKGSPTLLIRSYRGGRMNGAESLIRTAIAAGVEVCFANPGTTEMPLVLAIDAIPGIRAILGLFEGVCTGAADGYARMAGKPAFT